MNNQARTTSLYLLLFATLFISSCSVFQMSAVEPKNRSVDSDSEEGRYFLNTVKPIIEARCVSCHACYDAPCQLKLSSAKGIDRGTHKNPVYNGTRLIADKPTRLFLDHHTTQAWRKVGFQSVFNDKVQQPELNKSAGLLYQALNLKRINPLPDQAILPDDEFEFGVSRKHSCPTPKQYARFARKNPMAGMPYGLPGLADSEMQSIARWIENGATMAELEVVDPAIVKQVQQWETFLNRPSNKEQLASRYIYEHLHLANLYFSEAKLHEIDQQAPEEKVYFKMVRSTTAPGEAISVIATRRPSDNPGVEHFYYRLQFAPSTIVSKTHLPYALNKDRMDWMDELFIEPDYSVGALPGYDDKYLNPFLTFKDIPTRSRYRFMLEESKFIIGGFIKGPVCRGQVAVDVINDHFWVFFVDPDTDAIPGLDQFVADQSQNLRLPGIEGSTAGIVGPWTEYSSANKDYLLAKRNALKDVFANTMELNEALIWDGDGNNGNAALTIFRNFDSASVVQGLIGQNPKTAWVIDYPLLERIHYLLAVDFDVYGNVGHQLNTRLYMDFLRIEGEYNFLTLMPLKERLELRDFWYRDASEKVKEYLYSCESYLDEAPSINYSTAQPKVELYNLLKKRLSSALQMRFDVSTARLSKSAIASLHSLHKVIGTPATVMPEVTTLLVASNHGENTLFSVIANKAHSNITSLFNEDKYRLPNEDTLTVAHGVVGDNPNAFLRVSENDLPRLVDMIESLESETDYKTLMSAFGVRRTNKDFWQHSDVVHRTFSKQQPDLTGRLDYNRLENR